MNYYIQGNAAKADQIKAAFEELGISIGGYDFSRKDVLFFTFEVKGKSYMMSAVMGSGLDNIIKTHPDYKELELPVEPKFKAEDRIVSKSDKSTIYRIITLHEERREYIVEIEHNDYHESCPWIAFEDQDDFELAPKKHYAIANFHAGMPVLVRDGDCDEWNYLFFSHYRKKFSDHFFAGGSPWCQCVPFSEDTKHLLGTADMCPEEYINW